MWSFHMYHVLHGFMDLFLFNDDHFQAFSLRRSYFMQFQTHLYVILHSKFEGVCYSISRPIHGQCPSPILGVKAKQITYIPSLVTLINI